jgi:hypothetical protein
MRLLPSAAKRALFGAAFTMIVLFPGTATAEPQTIRPGEIWPDDRGLHIQAHGGGILKHEGVYYWFGEDRSEDIDPEWRAVACYASTDLVNWQFRNRVFHSKVPSSEIGYGRRWVLERPKVYYNQQTKQFVMYMHIDGTGPSGEGHAYLIGHVGIAVSDTVDGDYTWVRHFRPLGKESRDIGQFIDEDGTAYLIFESRPTGGFYIAKLSDDYLDVVEATCFIRNGLEGGALIKYDGLYYLIGSHMTGWDPNPNKYATSTSLAGPWSEFKDIAPPAKKTYGSQSTMMVRVDGTKATTVIFMGDIWKPRTQWDSRYLWMPLEIGEGRLWLPEPAEWTLDIVTGEAVIKR